ncbi:MAG: hypothetical protein E6Q67_01765 [Roseateles sp.]|nr:MAG: hypothetical protein E6Q67_01765 [Roseateles sp.]
MGIARRLFLALFALSLAACSGKPSDSEATRLFNEENQRLGLADLFDIENAKRVNGYEKEGRYVVEMQFDVVVKMDYQEMVDALTRKAGDDFLARGQLNANIEVLQREYGKFTKGQRFTKKRPMVLQRTEAGWALAW